VIARPDGPNGKRLRCLVLGGGPARKVRGPEAGKAADPDGNTKDLRRIPHLLRTLWHGSTSGEPSAAERVCDPLPFSGLL